MDKECQKSVTSMALLKLLKLNFSGSVSEPATSLVISLGFLKAIINAIYKGKNTVIVPKISTPVNSQFVFPIFFIIVAPPFYLIQSFEIVIYPQ